MDILFIQPWDRPWTNQEYVAARREMYISRAQFEVGFAIPAEYSVAFLDLNVELRAGKDVKSVVTESVREHNPWIVMISFPTYVLGEQIGEIIAAIKGSGISPAILVGGSVISLIHDLPLSRWESLTACYNGFGKEVPALILACLEGTRPPIPGVYWQGEPRGDSTRGEPTLVDDYTPEAFYTSRGRFDFRGYLQKIREAGLSPIGIIEMTRGCSFRCDFCAINGARMGWNHRSAHTVASEAAYLAAHGVKKLHLIDPTFGLLKNATEELLGELACMKERFDVSIEMLTRPELVTDDLAVSLSRAGVTRCAIGMETMEDEDLQGVHKTLRAEKTHTAVHRLAANGIETKLFHIVFPGRLSRATLAFLLELSQEKVPFVIQTSFLRELPNRESRHPFITQDQTVYIPGKDTPEQLMEFVASNVAFPATRVNDAPDAGDPVVQELLRKALARRKPLKSLFFWGRKGRELSFWSGLFERVSYIHRDGYAVAANLE